MAKKAEKKTKCLKVYTVIDRGDQKKAIWLQIGAAFTNRDGSFNVKLNALPTDGRLHIREDSTNPAE